MNRLNPIAGLLIAGLLVLTACTSNTEPLDEQTPIPAATATVPDPPPAQPATVQTIPQTTAQTNAQTAAQTAILTAVPAPEPPRVAPRPVRKPTPMPAVINIRHAPEPAPPVPSARALDLAAKLEKFSIEERIAWLAQELEKRGVGNVYELPRQ